MTKDELWKVYVQRNPQFERPGAVTLTSAGLKKLFEQTYDQAHAAGVKAGINAQELKLRADSLFGKIFGN